MFLVKNRVLGDPRVPSKFCTPPTQPHPYCTIRFDPRRASAAGVKRRDGRRARTRSARLRASIEEEILQEKELRLHSVSVWPA
eukprot:755797-Hanusia_phi.AAC.6